MRITQQTFVEETCSQWSTLRSRPTAYHTNVYMWGWTHISHVRVAYKPYVLMKVFALYWSQKCQYWSRLSGQNAVLSLWCVAIKVSAIKKRCTNKALA